MTFAVGLAIGGSGLLFLALAAFVASMRPRTRANLAFAAYAAGYGLEFVILGTFESFARALPVGGLTSMAAMRLLPLFVIGPALVVLATSAPRPLGPQERRFLLPALLVAGALAAGMAPGYFEGRAGLLVTASAAGVVLALGGLYAAAALLTLRFHAAKGPERDRDRFVTSLLAAALLLQEGMRAGGFAVGRPELRLGDLVGLGALLLFGLAWLWNTARGGGIMARRVAWTAFGAPLAGMLIPVLLDAPGDLSFAAARVVAAALIAYAILRHQLFNIDVKVRWTISRSTIAAAFVAAFFLASEGAQLLFGQGNEWVGLAAAGALVFAIAPLQRAAERLAERAVPVAAPGDPAEVRPGSRAEEAYRAVLQRYLRDGTLTRDEERALAMLAGELKLDAGRAFELREEVERDVGAPREVR